MRATAEPMPENRTYDKENGLWRVKIESESGEFEYRHHNVTHSDAVRKLGT